MPKLYVRRPFWLAAGALVAVLVVAGDIGAQAAQYYVLDGFGGVHAGGGAPAISPGTPYFGFDIAKDVVYIPFGAGAVHGDGVFVLDGFGGVHAGGKLPPVPPSGRTPYFGFNIARAIAYRNVPPRGAGASSANGVELTMTSASNTSVINVIFDAPDDGFLLVNGSTSVFCNSGTAGTATVEVRLDVDSTAGNPSTSHFATFPNCTAASPGVVVPVESIGITQAFFVSAGSHTVHLLARKAGGSLGVVVDSPSLTVIFVDQNSVGSS
jgi:hypothetical protein